MKANRKVLTLGLGLFVLTGFGNVQSAAAEYVIKFSHVVSPHTPKGQAADIFAKLVNKRMAGKVKVVVFPNSQLYNDNKVMEAMRLSDSKTTGIMAAPSLSKFVKFSRQMQAFDLPFLFNDIVDVHKLADSKLVEEMTKPMERKGIKALSFWDNGMKVFSIKSDKPLTKVPADFRGNKFRIQSSEVHAAMIKALGGTPQKLSFKEVYTSLAQGVVDGQENAWSNVYSKKFYEVQDYITVSNHSYLGYLVVVSKSFWNNLPEDIRSELTAIMKMATSANRRFAAKADSEDRAKIEKAGKAKVVELSAADRAMWVKATSKVEDKFRRQIGAKILKDIHTLLGH
ncbi:MAG: TRAP transporter substrate-binding protein [Magnetococcales bacterium]|nr:TRAP transporter substrate-binding protein [Magnetococcales bacterium]